MVTMATADQALKSFYLDAVTDALDKSANPFLAQIKKSTADVLGKDVRKLVRFGVNGGITAGEETEELLSSSAENYVQFVSTLKNLYGTIEISDKAIRASKNDEGAFVNLLNDEMDNMIKSASFNFGRMLFGDGSGKLATVRGVLGDNVVAFDSVKNLFEGMKVYAFNGEDLIGSYLVVSVDRGQKKAMLSGATKIVEGTLPTGSYLSAQATLGQEITGLGAIFANPTESLYGVSRDNKYFLLPYKKSGVGEIDEEIIQTAIDSIEENTGGRVNFIVCSWGVRRALAAYYRQHNIALSTQEIEGGYKALSFAGIPVVADRFCPEGTMYLLNTDDFCIHQLCDWQWLEGEDGKVLSKLPNKPVYSATLVKYAELMCSKPGGQGMLSGITEK